MALVSTPSFASLKPVPWRSMCGWIGKPMSAAFPSRASIFLNPAVVNGAPRSEVNTNGEAGCCSRLSRRSARSFGPLQGYVQSELHRELVYSRSEGSEKEYVQDRLRNCAVEVAELLRKDNTHIYVCGLRGLEDGVESALANISREHGIDWSALRPQLRKAGRFHVETY
jgi:hypothetical protein